MSQNINLSRSTVGCSVGCPAAKSLGVLRSQNILLKEQLEVLRTLIAAMHARRESDIHKDPLVRKVWLEEDLDIRVLAPPVFVPFHRTYNDVQEMREIVAEQLGSLPEVASVEVLGVPRNPVFLPCRCAPGAVEHDCSFTGRAGDLRVTFLTGNVAIFFVACGIDSLESIGVASRAAITYYSTVPHGIPPPAMFLIIATSREREAGNSSTRLGFACQELFLETVLVEEPEVDDVFGSNRLAAIHFKDAIKNPFLKHFPGIQETPPGPKPTIRLIKALDAYHDPMGLVASSVTNPGIVLPHVTLWVQKERDRPTKRPDVPDTKLEQSNSPAASVALTVQATIPKLIHNSNNTRPAPSDRHQAALPRVVKRE